MAETEELTCRKWTVFVRGVAIERIISGERRGMLTKVEEIRKGDLIHLFANDDPADNSHVWIRVTDRDGDVLSIEVDDDRYRKAA